MKKKNNKKKSYEYKVCVYFSILFFIMGFIFMFCRQKYNNPEFSILIATCFISSLLWFLQIDTVLIKEKLKIK